MAVLACSVPARLRAGPPYLTDDPEPVGLNHWEIYAFSLGMSAPGNTAGLGPAVEVNYGAFPGVHLHAMAPLAYNDTDNVARTGFGDFELGAKIRIAEEDKEGWLPEAAIYPTIDTPTGNPARGLGTGHSQIFLPLWLQRTHGPWAFDAGGGVWINPGAGNRNYYLTGFLVTRQMTPRFTLGGEIFHQSAAATGLPDITGFNLGAAYDLSDHWHLLASAGRGLADADRRDRFTYYLGVQNTF